MAKNGIRSRWSLNGTFYDRYDFSYPRGLGGGSSKNKKKANGEWLPLRLSRGQRLLANFAEAEQ